MIDGEVVWRPAWFCTECDKSLTHSQVMNSHGMCPKCGIVRAVKIAVPHRFTRVRYISWLPWPTTMKLVKAAQ